MTKSINKQWFVLLAAPSVSAMSVGVGIAQQGGGTISGSVTNSQGAAISGSAVEVKSVATNAVFSAVTNTSGFYTAPSLAVGEYEVAAQFEGFKRAVRSGITLQVNQTARIDIVLEIGEVVETIEVVGEAPLVQSDTSTLGEVIERRRMVELPINGRGALALTLLTAGVVSNAGPLNSGFGDRGIQISSLSINGSPNSMNAQMLDGNNNILSYVGEVGVPPAVDSVEEFKVQSGTMSAEFGFTAGGTINLVTRSGTNQIHGTVYEFLRNDKLDARNTFASTKLPLRYNQFGASVGGPIIKDRTFGFFNWEDLVIHFTLVGGRVLGSNVSVGQCLTENQLFDESVEDLAYVAGLSTVEAKGEFVEVALEMHFTHLPLVSRSQPALQQRGNQVNMREFLGCQPRVSRRVGDPVAVAGFLQAPVTPPAVGMDQTAWLHTVAHKTHQTRARCVGDMAQTDPPHSAAFQFHRNHNQGFAHKLSPANVLLLAAQVSLVDLDTSAQPFPSQPNHRLPQLRQHQPGRLIAAQTEFTLQTLSAQPCFLGAGQPHCQKPTPQRHPRVVQDGSRSGRGLASAGATEHRASPRRPTLRGRAVRTNESRGPADADQILATGLLAGKPFSELHQMLWKVLAQLPRSSPPTARVQG